VLHEGITIFLFDISLPTIPIITASLLPLLYSRPGLSISPDELAKLVKRAAHQLPQAHGVHSSLLTCTLSLRYTANLLNDLEL
jgi:hypothetical protein